MGGISSIPKYNGGAMGGGSILGAAGGSSIGGGAGLGGIGSQSVPPLGGGGYKYSGSGIGGPIGSLGGAPQYNFGSIPKYSSSGIAGGIG